MNHPQNHDRDDLSARISCWLSGELDRAAARGLNRAVDRDRAGRRIAAGYQRVDALVRDWYDSLPVEPERPATSVPRPAPRRPLVGLAAALAGCVVVACSWLIDPAAACAGLTRAAATAILSAVSSPPRLEPTAYWNLRSAALDWTLRGGRGVRTMAADPRGS
jgi:ferric-dicitrate binding protein FerR (iron transport regulator)